MRKLSSRKELRMSKKIVKQIRASVDYLSSLKVDSSLEVQKVIDFLFEATFFDRDDDYFAKIVKAEGYDAEKYLWFDGKRYTRKEDGHYRGYHGKYLHRAVWEHFNGKIPKGYVVHHVDFNPANNDISNLTLLTKAEHRKLHTELYEPQKYICEYCGKEFESKHRGKPNRFCSHECSGKWSYRNNHEIRICAECGKEFTAYKYSKKKYCSISCSNKARSRKK